MCAMCVCDVCVCHMCKGEGKTGDMEWKGGNKVLREGAGKGKRILLFTLMERVASTAQFEGYHLLVSFCFGSSQFQF